MPSFENFCKGMRSLPFWRWEATHQVNRFFFGEMSQLNDAVEELTAAC